MGAVTQRVVKQACLIDIEEGNVDHVFIATKHHSSWTVWHMVHNLLFTSNTIQTLFGFLHVLIYDSWVRAVATGAEMPRADNEQHTGNTRSNYFKCQLPIFKILALQSLITLSS